MNKYVWVIWILKSLQYYLNFVFNFLFMKFHWHLFQMTSFTKIFKIILFWITQDFNEVVEILNNIGLKNIYDECLINIRSNTTEL